MKIKGFQIANYRSIRDSGMCKLSGDGVTVLAGMNESGKTSILEALEDFNTDKEIRKEANPLSTENHPEITVKFDVSSEILSEIKETEKLSNLSTKDIDINITKGSDNSYSLSNTTYRELGLLPNSKSNGKTNKQLTESQSRFLKSIYSRIPNFILFSSFDDIFPSEFYFPSELNHSRHGYYSNNEPDIIPFIKDLSIISNLELENIYSGTSSQQAKNKKKLNFRFNDEYKQYWDQDLNNLYIDWDSEKMYFLIEEGDEYFPPYMRSKGKQWHLSFYVKISARAKENKSNVLLIDEPGLYLHPRAQRDVIKKLEDSAKTSSVIFSTHSPYLIDTEKLHRVKLVSRGKKGTIVSDNFSANADKESLTPVITAIGLDVSMGLDIAKNNNILTEGISDYYYLSAFKDILDFKFKDNVHIIPGAGVNKYKFLVPLLIGWDLNFCAVLDSDKAGKDASKILEQTFGKDIVKEVFVSDSKDISIEDLFSQNDFLNYVLKKNSDNAKKNVNNSQRFNGNNSKLLLAKEFYENRKKIKSNISNETKLNFELLLSKINESLFDSK